LWWSSPYQLRKSCAGRRLVDHVSIRFDVLRLSFAALISRLESASRVNRLPRPPVRTQRSLMILAVDGTPFEVRMNSM
jgi:hypothetical protein